jgi:hypothetical protein
MSDYKIVNGKKARVCKYSCGTMLVWSDDISKFIEETGGVIHTQERCKSIKESKKSKQQFTLEAVLKKLESIGVKIDLDKLMNSK